MPVLGIVPGPGNYLQGRATAAWYQRWYTHVLVRERERERERERDRERDANRHKHSVEHNAHAKPACTRRGAGLRNFINIIINIIIQR